MKLLPWILVLCLLYLSPVQAQQRTLKGTVVDKETRDALPGANVFINQTTIGVSTSSTGGFVLNNLPVGKQTVVVSMIGFKTFSYPLDELLALGDRVIIELEPDPILLDQIQVTAKKPRRWLRNLEIFKEQFLGITDNAKQTIILNPEVIDFENQGNDLFATARAPLEIENRALGYHIQFHLEQFLFNKEGLISSIYTDGYSVYKELESENDQEKQNWLDERNRAYKGSFTHFIHALFADQLKPEGFLVYFDKRLRVNNGGRSPEVERTRSIYSFTKELNEIKLKNSKTDFLRVQYINERAEEAVAEVINIPAQFSWISFPNEYAIVDIKTGKEPTAFRSKLHGYWGMSHRIADLLPSNYRTAL